MKIILSVARPSMSMQQLLRIINRVAFKGKTISDINGGDCYNWAAVVQRFIPKVKLYSEWGHAFIGINKLFYDSERIRGVADWKKLPSNKTVPSYIQLGNPLNLGTFTRKWKIDVKHIDKLTAIVKQFLRDNR